MENTCEKNVVFIGFMGAGKTTIGKLLAEKLNREYIDVDEEIEKEYKLTVTAIFEKFGEQAFREKERNLITSICKQKGVVISVGGGAFLQQEIRQLCLDTSIVIFLDLSFEGWKDRIDLIIDSRPVLQGKSIEEMKHLFNNRQGIYANHHLKIATDNKDAEVLANEIVSKLRVDFDIMVKSRSEATNEKDY